MQPTDLTLPSFAPVACPIAVPEPRAPGTIIVAAGISLPLRFRGSITTAPSRSHAEMVVDGGFAMTGIAASITLSQTEMLMSGPKSCDLGEVLLVAPDEWLAVSPVSDPIAIRGESTLCVQMRDTRAAPLGDVQHLGPIDWEPLEFSLSVRLPVRVIVRVETDGRLPTTVGGELVFCRGAVLHCSPANGGGESGATPGQTITAISEGQVVHFPERLASLEAPAPIL